MATDKFYLPLSTLVNVGDLPDELQFLQGPLTNLIDKLYYKDLQFSKSKLGDSAFYSLKLVTYLPPPGLELTIPGTEMGIVFMPDAAVSTTAGLVIPTMLQYEWKILRFIKGFRPETFADNPAAFFNTLLLSLGLSREEIIGQAITEFSGVSGVNGLVDDVNAYFNTSFPYPSGANLSDQIQEVVSRVETLLQMPFEPILFAIYILDPGSEYTTHEKLNKLFSSLLGGKTVKEFMQDLLIPKINVSFHVGAGLKFPRNMLVPLETTVGPNYGTPIPGNVLLLIDAGTFYFNTDDGIGFDKELTASLPFCQIANTGLRLSVTDVKLDLSRKKNIPEATADGRPDDFIGVFVKEAHIQFPKFWNKNMGASNVDLYGTNLLMGTGGFSGKLGLKALTPAGLVTPLLQTNLGSTSGFSVGIDTFEMVFKQNAIMSCKVKGFLTIPGFEDPGNPGNPSKIAVDLSIGNDTFELTASSAQGVAIQIPGVFKVLIHSLVIGREPDPGDPGNYRFYVRLSGDVFILVNNPTTGLPVFDTAIHVERFTIYDDGTFEFPSGVSLLPKTITVNLGPAHFTITALTFGKHEQMHAGIMRKYAFFGFDGGLNLEPGGLDARGEGLKLYYTVDNDPLPLDFFFRISGIKIDLIIPGNCTEKTAAVVLKGYLSLKQPDPGSPDPDAGEEYSGGIDFKLPRVEMGGSAKMRINPKKKAFIVDAALEMSTPILLGSTGLGIYGFRGLFGQKFVASKSAIPLAEDAEWWQYYKAKLPPGNHEGVQVEKFAYDDGFSVGAGVSLATAPDSGKTFSSKLFFLLSLPQVFLFQGQAAILKQRIGLDTVEDPPFFAMIAITDHSIEAAFGANYKLPDDTADPGAIAKVDGVIEMGFFFGDAAAWYVNIGRETPEDRRIQARLLKLFNAYFYLMISSQGIRGGAGSSFAVNKKFGPLRAELSAYLDVKGQLSFKPKQIGGSIQMGGSVGLYIFGLGFTISAAASLAAEAPKPFIVTGSLEVCVKVLGKDRCAKFNFTWTFDHDLEYSMIAVLAANLSEAARAVNMQTEETYALYANAGTSLPAPALLENFIVPMDSFIDMEFVKPVKPSAGVMGLIGGNTMASKYIEFVAPQRGKSDRVRHEYALNSFEILYYDTVSGWLPYDVYDGSTPLAVAPFVTAPLGTLKAGYWQYQSPDVHNKLRLLGMSPLSWSSQGAGNVVPEELGITAESIFCEQEEIEKQCVNFNLYDRAEFGIGDFGQLLPPEQLIYHEKFLLKVERYYGSVTTKTVPPWKKAARIEGGDCMEIFFDEPMNCVDIQLQTYTEWATVSFYGREATGGFDTSGLPVYADVLYQSSRAYPGTVRMVSYLSTVKGVYKVKICAGDCVSRPIKTNDYEQLEAIDMEAFTARLAANGHLTTGVDLASHYAEYEDVFFGTSIYPSTDPIYNPVYSVSLPTSTHLVGQVSDTNGFVMSFELTQIGGGGLAIEVMETLEGTRPDYPNITPGMSSYYRISGRAGNGTYVEYQGVNDLYFMFEHRLPETLPYATETGYRLKEFLSAFVDQGGHLASDFEIYAENNPLFQGIFQGSLLYAPKQPHAEIRSSAEILSGVLTIHILEQDASGVLFEETVVMSEQSHVTGFDMAQITEILDVKPDLSNLEVGPNRRSLMRGKTSTGVESDLVVLTTVYETVGVPTPSTGIPGWCGGELTLQALQLQKFLSALLQGNLLLSNGIDLADPSLATYMNHTYFNTILFGDPYRPNYVVMMNQTIYDTANGILEFEIEATNGFHCSFSLETVPPQALDFATITSFTNLRPDTGSLFPGVNYNFLVDAHISGVTITLRGRSCYPVIICGEDCAAYLYEVCFLPYQALMYNLSIMPQSYVNAETTSMINGFNGSLQPIWRPNTHFAIRMNITDSVFRDATGTALAAPYQENFVFGFKTVGPPGHYHNYKNVAGVDTDRADYAALLTNDREDQFKLTGILHYLDIEKSYPHAIGNVINAKPLYFVNPQLLLFYTQSYMYQMMADWDTYGGTEKVFSQLEVQLKDPAEAATTSPGAPVLPSWVVNPFPMVSEEVTILTNMVVSGTPCATVTTPSPLGVNSQFDLPELAPLKLYEAIFNARYKRLSDPSSTLREVHRYNFQTSRYADFSTHIKSYQLLMDGATIVRAALYDVSEAFDGPTQVVPGQAIVTGSLPSTDGLVLEYQHVFDRLVTGALKMIALDAALNLEFNVVRNTNTGNVLGILVRGPEPLNDPKTPSSVLTDTLTLSVNGGSVGDYMAIFSKDLSQAFVTNTSGAMNIPAGGATADFTFRYKLWDGNAYTTLAVETVNLTIA